MKSGREQEPGGDEVERLTRVYRGYSRNVASKWSRENQGNLAMLAERYRVLGEMLDESGLLPLAGKRILDVGCGTGQLLSHFAGLGADVDALHGVDLMPERIEAARENLPGGHFRIANAETLEYEDQQFDLVVLQTVLSSILAPQMRRNVVAEVARVTAADGAVLVYDLRVPSPTNPHVRGISRRDVRNLFPGWRARARSLTMLPPVARRLGGLTDRIYGILAGVPVLRTHNMVVLRRPENHAR